MTVWVAAALAATVFLVWPRRLPVHRRVPGRVRDERSRPTAPSGAGEGGRSAVVPGGLPAAVIADLMVALLDAGLPVETALELLAEQTGPAPWAGQGGADPVLDALDLATSTGIAPAALVGAAAAEHRRREAAAHAAAANRLAVMAVLPMGLCLLPAFVLLTVVPLLLGLLGDL